MIIGIGGEPATGKSTLVRAVMAALGPGEPFKQGLVKGTTHTLVVPGSPYLATSVAVLGTYDDPKFPGTDRLSMGAQPKVLEWLARADRPKVVLFEGDRLFTGSFMTAAPYPAFFYLLVTNPADLEQRHVQRGDTQGATFKKGRETKYKNLRAHPRLSGIETHETPDDTKRLVDLTLGHIRDWLKPLG